MKSVPSLFIALLFLAGCATAPPPLTEEEIRVIDYGPAPKNADELIRKYLAETGLSDVQFRIGEPYKGYVQHGQMFDGKVFMAGYIVDVWLRGKDEAGAPLPEDHLAVLIKNGQVLMQLSGEDLEHVKTAL